MDTSSRQFPKLLSSSVMDTYKQVASVIVIMIVSFVVLVSDLYAKENLTPTENLTLKTFPMKVNQGVAVDADFFYAIDNTQVVKCEKETGKILLKWEADVKVEAYAHFKHLNSATVIDGKLYAAHSRFPFDPDNCSVEIWDVTQGKLKHERTIKLPKKYGSLTWIDQGADGSWWMCFAVYGKDKNKATKLVKYSYQDHIFTELESWNFPNEVVSQWAGFSCSGGSWGPDGLLYTTGHDGNLVHVLKLDKDNSLRFIRSENVPSLYGQAIAWDRSAKAPTLWGIVRNKHVSSSLMLQR